jgi:hypothetical protein
VDADSMLEADALLRAVQPFVEDTACTSYRSQCAESRSQRSWLH